jgi:hypothetical protein
MRSPLTGEAVSSEMTVLNSFCIKAVSRMASFEVVELNEKKPGKWIRIRSFKYFGYDTR